MTLRTSVFTGAEGKAKGCREVSSLQDPPRCDKKQNASARIWLYNRRMTVYAEQILLDNFLVDASILLATCRILARRTRWWRITLAALLGAVCALSAALVGGALPWVLKAVTAPLKDDRKAASPGMKYKHYAPKAQVTILKGSAEAFREYVNAHAEDGTAALCFEGETDGLSVPYVTYGRRDDDAAQARQLFEALRTADDRGARVLYAACPRPIGVGLAVYNRLLRAAGFRVVTL